MGNVYVRNRANSLFWTIFKNCHHFTHKSVQKCNFGFYLITGNYTNEIRLKVCQKSNISEKNIVANFGFNCKNGKVSPILRLHAITRVRIRPKLNFCQSLPKMIYSVQFNHIKCLVPNCPGAKLSGAKLSGCQIVRFYFLGAKLSAFIILVPNCLLYYLGTKLSGAKLSGAKLSYNQNQVPYF